MALSKNQAQRGLVNSVSGGRGYFRMARATSFPYDVVRQPTQPLGHNYIILQVEPNISVRAAKTVCNARPGANSGLNCGRKMDGAARNAGEHIIELVSA